MALVIEDKLAVAALLKAAIKAAEKDEKAKAALVDATHFEAPEMIQLSKKSSTTESRYRFVGRDERGDTIRCSEVKVLSSWAVSWTRH